MSHIFISYSHKDQAYAHKLHQHLFEHGFDTWIDDRLDYGSRWPFEIENRIRGCSVFILIMSPDAYKSEWVLNELALARQLGKPIYTLLLEGDPWWHLGTIQYVDVRNGELPPSKFFVSLAKIAPQDKNNPNVSIHVNGNVQGNIVVGNDNDVQSSVSKREAAEKAGNNVPQREAREKVPAPRPQRQVQPQPVAYAGQSTVGPIVGPPPAYAGQAPAGKKSNSTMSFIIVVILLLLCACAVGAFLWFAPCQVFAPIVGGVCG